jgi:hypothetical protein
MTKEFYIDETNPEFGPVVRWGSSNNIPFLDKLTEFKSLGLITEELVLNSTQVRKIESAKQIQEYIASREQYGYSDEERFEIQASFGNEEVVDIFTGERIQ